MKNGKYIANMQHEKEIQAIKMARLFLNKSQGQLNEAEQRAIQQWLASSELNRKVYQDMLKAENIENELNQLAQYNAEVALERVKGKRESKLPIVPVWKITAKWVAATAAIFFIVFSIGLYWYSSNQPEKLNDPIARFGGDANPGTNRATLTLADGSRINLSDDKEGIIIGNKDIKYVDGKAISAQGISAEAEKMLNRGGSKTETQLTLSTPKGGQYQVTLADGTKVWLNTASTLKYPQRFIGKQRRIELVGEAYFEVAHNRKQPFVVSSNGQEVTVLGTHFNINAYPDESDIKTTLIQGSVSVSTMSSAVTNSSSTILSPGQQSIFVNGKLGKVTVNPETAIAWKDNLFIFHNSNLKTIMRQISRWYDIEVDIHSMPDVEFYAEIPRNVKLSQVLSMLEATSNIKFKIVTDNGNNKKRRIIIEK